MHAALAHSRAPQRGARLLITHCETLGESRRPAAVRLAEMIGDELAQRLVSALANAQPPRLGGLGS
jgi:hypothetical protein